VAGDYLLKSLRAERTRGFLIEKLNEVLERSEDKTWGELLAPIDDETLVGWIVQGARSSRVRDLAEEAVRSALEPMLSRPIGRPGRWFPDDIAHRLTVALSPAIWDWLQAQLPVFVQRLNVQQVVEEKVLGFSTQRVEEIIRGVMQRELNFIVKCGFVLGGLIGVGTFFMQQLIGALSAGPLR
jgi:uncharacterized membrane protein YheB (UPF0754 family)